MTSFKFGGGACSELVTKLKVDSWPTVDRVERVLKELNWWQIYGVTFCLVLWQFRTSVQADPPSGFLPTYDIVGLTYDIV